MYPAPRLSRTQQQQLMELRIGFLGIQGRNGSDPSILIPDRQCVEAYNVDWYRSGLGHKRGGHSTLANAFKSLAMFRHVPGDDQTLAEFWAMDDAGVLHRYSGGAWSIPLMKDACSASPQETVFCSFNGKLYIAYKSAHNRLHVWDPDSASVRRCGLDLPAAPTTGAPAGGAVTATRKYRVSWCVQSGGITIRRSNLGAASGSVALVAQQVVVTRPAVPGEGETHWELWEAQDANFSDYRLLGTTVIATATFADNTNAQPSTVAPLDGANTPPPSARYVVSDTGRIIMGGAWEVAANTENAMVPKTTRLWWTSVLGASSTGNNLGNDDSERISNTGTINNYADISEAVTGISYPMQVVQASATSLERGSFYVFSYSGQWKFVSTTSGEGGPYLQFQISSGAGCIHHKSIVTSQDANGSPMIMWAATSGVFRITTQGQEYCGEDNIDLWAGLNTAATIPVHSVPYPDKHQVWFYYATGTDTYPTQKLCFDTRLGKSTQDAGVRLGWSLHVGEGTHVYCSSLFSTTLGATVGRKLVPHVGYAGAATTQEIWKADTTDLDDAGTSFQAYIDSKSYIPWGLGHKGGLIEEPIVIADVAPGITVHLTIYRDEGKETGVFNADLSAHSDSEAETLVFAKFDGAQLADSHSFRCRVGDLVATPGAWNLHGIVSPADSHGVA